MKTEEIRRNCVIVADTAQGGTLDMVSPEGEIIHFFHVPPGRHRASQWLDLLDPGYTLQIGEGLFCFQPRMGVSHTRHPDALHSDANPSFIPTSATRLEREMRIELNEMRSARLSLQKEARQRALDSVQVAESIPKNPAPEPKPAPAPEPKPAPAPDPNPVA